MAEGRVVGGHGSLESRPFVAGRRASRRRWSIASTAGGCWRIDGRYGFHVHDSAVNPGLNQRD